MANPLMGMMGGGAAAPAAVNPQMQNMQAIRQAAQSAKRMMGMLQAVKDPMSVIRQVPALNAAYEMCNGRNPEQVFREECQKSGVNPDDVMNLLRG